MAKVKVLPDTLANKIAAGEIVERPASVVKELLENALDAQSRTLAVEAGGGGKQLIRVRDDGEGMSRDDALLAFEHHATSKISSAEDLMSITSLGFRGEALPSIASVSRLTLRTIEARPVESAEPLPAVGTEIEFEGGILKQVRENAWSQGTEVTVRDLFFNMPARRKFLKTNDTELSHITRLVTQYALAHSDKAFILEHQGKAILNCPPVLSLADRIYQIFGEAFLKGLIEVNGQAGSLSISGYTSLPHEARSNATAQYFFVNRRMVRDRLISHALNQAYRPVNPSSLYPVVILFIEIPPAEVDVNVHPAKTEVRFSESDRVHRLVQRAIESAFTHHKVFPAYERRAGGEGLALEGRFRSLQEDSRSMTSLRPSPLSPAALPGPQLFGPTGATAASAGRPYETSPSSSLKSMATPAAAPSGGDPAWPLESSVPVPPLTNYEIPLTLPGGGARALAQLHESFILAADREGLLIIDQHVAHERVLYEQTLEQMANAAPAAQSLLMPLTFDLTPSQKLALTRIQPELRAQGFDVEEFGGATIALKAAPAIAAEADLKRLLLGILETLDAEAPPTGLQPLRERLAAGIACRAAIKVNMPLNLEKMQWLIEALWLTQVPTHCPHGRPIILRLSMRDLEKNFHRI